jgi:Tetratricopeptide repeat.
MLTDTQVTPRRAVLVMMLAVMVGCVDGAGGVRRDVAKGPIVPAPPPEPSIELRDVLTIHHSLAEEDFAALDQRLVWNADSARRDPGYEGRYAAAFDVFAVLDTVTGRHLDDWVARDSAATVPHIARAMFRLAAAHDARGDDRQVTDEEAAHEGEWLRLAGDDIDSAVRADSTNVMTCVVGLDAARGALARPVARRVLDAGLRQLPSSVALRMNYMWLMRRRWGGSARAMEQFAEECDSAAVVNPRFRLVRGMIPLDAGIHLYNRSKNIEAAKTFGEALAYGDHWLYRYNRGDAYFFAKDYDRAVEDYTAALQQRPGHIATRARRAAAYDWLAYKSGPGAAHDSLLALARGDFSVAYLLDPSNVTVTDVADDHPALRPAAALRALRLQAQ